jgi:hypothetical protein
VVGAGAWLLLLAAGCATDSFNLSFFASSPAREEVVAAPLDSVSASAQATLRNLGLFVSSNRDGDSVRLKSTTSSGEHFVLVLKRQMADQGGGEQTRVRIEWDKNPDEQFWFQLLSGLTSNQPAKEKGVEWNQKPAGTP